MRWSFACLTVLVAAVGLVAPVVAQVDPNQPPNVLQQIQENMNNAGVTPQDLIQQARDQIQQNGTFDPQAFTQQLQQQGIINQGMLDQFQQQRNQMQQRNQQRQMTSLQQLLNSPDDEWAVLGSKIQRVMDLNADLNPAAQSPNQRGQFVQQATAAQGPVTKAMVELRTLLQNENSSEADIRTKLIAYRDARQRVQADLASARQDLLALLTLRQEAILLNMDVLN